MADTKDTRATRHWNSNPSHTLTDTNPFGTHDRIGIQFEMNIPLRCPWCSNLFDQSELDFRQCPNCHHPFTNDQAIDMYVEAVQVSAHGGWGPAIMDLLRDQGRKVSYIVNKNDGSLTPVSKVHRQLTAHHTASQRQELAQARAQKALIDHLRGNSVNRPLM